MLGPWWSPQLSKCHQGVAALKRLRTAAIGLLIQRLASLLCNIKRPSIAIFAHFYSVIYGCSSSDFDVLTLPKYKEQSSLFYREMDKNPGHEFPELGQKSRY